MSVTPGERHGTAGGFAPARSRALQRLARPSGRERAAAFQLSRAEERRLVAAARAGDARALRRLLELLSGPIYRFGRGFCGNPQDAEDVAQVSLAALARTLASFRGDASLTTWAYTVARNACRRQRRRRADAPDRLEPLERDGRALELPDLTADPARAFERVELRQALERAIASLPEPQRGVILLRDVEGLPAAEVGERLGLGERAVKSRLHRARVALRERLAPYLADGPRAGGESPCPDTAQLLSRFLEGELDAEACAVLASHVERCPHCGATCDALRGAIASCRRWPQEPVPEEVRRAVRAALDEALEARGAPERPRARRPGRPRRA